MSRESRQRLRESTQTEGMRRRRRNYRRWFAAVLFLPVLGISVFAWRQHGSKLKSRDPSSAQAQEFKQPTTFTELCAIRMNDLEKCDIALMNLLCAERLRGAENLNVKECLERLDGIAKRVKFETDRHYYKYRQHPDEFNGSEGYYRMMMMATVLQQDLGIRYNPARRRTSVAGFVRDDAGGRFAGADAEPDMERTAADHSRPGRLSASRVFRREAFVWLPAVTVRSRRHVERMKFQTIVG